jgi:hypothetical protein
MLLPPANQPNTALLVFECGLTRVAIAPAFVWPRLGDSLFTRIEQSFARLARREPVMIRWACLLECEE